MKHNPRVHERLASLPGFRDLHPHADDEDAQGALELMWHLQGILAEVAGLPAVTLQPAAGSQGELTGLMLMRAYFADRGEERDTIITADTAHGTNPASVTMAGYAAREGRDRRAREPRPRRSPRQGERADRRAHAHEPVDARPLRRGHRGGGADLPRRGRAPLLRRREPECGGRDLTAGRHGLRHRPLQPPQDVLAAARGRWAGRRPGRRARDHRAVSAGARRRTRRRRVQARPRPRRSRSAASAASPGRSACSCARTPTCARTGRVSGRCRRSRF